ncbi:MAG: hypothetical protein CVV24_02275 [Ignavibacteriae bacterium HGW-Ignavibacteriae-3]|nr:MAG: hypothetical protein CVV24_02275 [Ignavibacteriae bacterium HGW-Ignavibacteriae-3]
MAEFNYRFASILNVKEILERKIKEEISFITKAIADIKAERKFVIEERIKTQREMMEHSLKVSEFQSVKMYDSLLERQIHLLEKKIEQWEQKKEEKQLELIERKKEVKSFETLRDNQYEDFLIEERRGELKEMNEIAIRNYNGVHK